MESVSEAWHKKPVGVFLIYVFTIWLWYWGVHIPSPGRAVAVLAVVAAAMSLRGEMGGKEKLAWILLLFGFLFVELNALDEEEIVRSFQQAQAHSEQLKNFQVIGEGIKATITASDRNFKATMGGIDTTLKTVRTAVDQTSPKAVVRFDTQDLIKTVTADTPFKFNMWYINSGTDSAENIEIISLVSVAKLDDLNEQVDLVRQLDDKWNKRTPDISKRSFVGGSRLFGTFSATLSRPDVNAVVARTKTIYFLYRFAFSDHIGRWYTDYCMGIQDFQTNGDVYHPCFVGNKVRYKPLIKQP